MRVVVLTCDKYAWLIPVFLHFYKKYWPNNPCKTEIVTEKAYIDGTVFYAGQVAWSNMLIGYLKQSKEDRILLILEDYFIRKTVNISDIEIAENLCTGNVGCVRLNNAPPKYFRRHTIDSEVEGFREYPLGERFSMSIQMAIWQKRYLLDILHDNESAWETELNASKRLKGLKSKWRILWPETNIIDYQPGGLMRKGILRPPVLKWAKAELSDGGMDRDSQKLYGILQNQIKIQKEA